jgi:hypothetical protein
MKTLIQLTAEKDIEYGRAEKKREWWYGGCLTLFMNKLKEK